MRSLDRHAGFKPAGWLHACVAGVLLSASAQAADSVLPRGASILYFEPFTTTIDPRPALTQKSTRSRQLKFDAYGRRFELALEPNERLQSARNISNPHSLVALYQGQLTGIENSWARISTRGSEVHGLVWDGTDLYVIEPSHAVRDALVPPLDASSTSTVLFRLSDTILDSPTAMCESPGAQSHGETPTDDPAKGSDAYASMKRELDFLKRSSVLMQAGSAGLRIEIAALGDAKFRERFASDAEALDEMMLRLNNVDGIFTAQLGVEIQVPTALVYTAATDPLPATTSSTDLLDQLGALRQRTPEFQSRGITHLFTGRDLDGATVGIGYVNALCRAKFAASLTEIRGRGAWLESLITAHEIGHNFGAVHDGEAQCAYVAQNQFLMSPTVQSAGATFSSCSRDVMATSIASASCITSLPPADLSVASDLGTVRASAGRAFEWELPITNLGGRASQQARVEVLVPSALSATDVWISGGSCTSGAGAITCDLGDVPGGSSRSLHVTLSGDTLGSNAISASVSSLSDADMLNNSAAGTVVVAAEITALQSPTPTPAPTPAPVPTPAVGQSDGGGGGSFGLGLLCTLLCLGTARRRPRP
jgi:hypothetical protein